MWQRQHGIPYILLHTAPAAEDTHTKYIILETTANWGEPRVRAMNQGVLPWRVVYKAAVAAGFYTDQIESDDPEG
jgi:hypothetical protein